MKHFSSAYLKYVGAIALSLASAASVSAQWIELLGSEKEDEIQLAWPLSGWEEGVTGFVVKAQGLEGTGDDWQLVHEGIIIPGLSADKDLGPVEQDAALRETLQQKLSQQIQAGEITEVSFETFVSAMRDPPSEDFHGALRREIFLDADRALFLGLGCRIRGAAARGSAYGLFVVLNGQVASNPVATFIPLRSAEEEAALQADSLQVIPREAGNTLVWRFPDAQVKERGIYGFQVYRSDDGDSWTRLTRYGVGSSQIDETTGNRIWTYVDKTALSEVDYRYRVIPYNFFQQEQGSSVSATTPVGAEDPLQAVSISWLRCEQVEGGDVALAWAAEDLSEGIDATWEVERLQMPATEFEPIASVPVDQPAVWVDAELKEHGAAYVYRVRLENAGLSAAVSQAQILVYMDLPVPPSPIEVQAQWVDTSDGDYIQLSWQAAEDPQGIIRGHVFYADKTEPGRLDRQASAPEVKAPGNETYLPVSLLVGRSMTVGVAAIGQGGQIGPPATLSLYAPGSMPAPLEELTVTTEDNGNISLEWSYPEGHDIAGFKLWQNNNLASDETKLDASARSLLIENLDTRKQYRFELVAVSRSGEASMPVAVNYFGKSLRASVEKPRRPESIQAIWSEDGQTIDLSWSYPGDASKIAGYHLHVDEEDLLAFAEPRFIEGGATNAFRFEVPNGERSYHFRLQAVAPADSAGVAATGIYQEAIALAPGKNLPPAKLGAARRITEDGTRYLRFSWSYPQEEQLAGFRLYQDDQLILDEEALRPSAREARIEAPDTESSHTFALEAIDQDGIASERAKPMRIGNGE